MGGCATDSVDIGYGKHVVVFDLDIRYHGYRKEAEEFEAYIKGPYPWDPDGEWGAWLFLGDDVTKQSPSDPDDNFTITVDAFSPSSISVTVVRCGLPLPRFIDVAVSRRYGDRLYLSGEITDIVEDDEICVYYSRPGDTGVRNLKSDTSDYLHFKDTSGSYDLGANNRYIEFERAGYHWLQIWDVSGDCETLLAKRAEWLMDIKLPRFQYQVIFDLANPDIVDSLHLLQAEYAKYEAAGSWSIGHADPDCFTWIRPIDTTEDDTSQSGWLSLGVEFGESPCAPLPYWLCGRPTPSTQYWRGECSCDLFRDTLQPLGIPCSHLIAAMYWYSGEPAWSDYVKCP